MANASGNAVPLDLDLRPGPASRTFVAVGRPASVTTRCRLQCHAGSIRIHIEADDPDMPNLVASVTEPDSDVLIYEDDCVQVALALPGAFAITGMLLVNARGSRRAFQAGKTWQAAVTRNASGWHMELDIAVPSGIGTVGLSLHRYFRGITGEVSGLTGNLPHPLEPSHFACLAISGSDPLATATGAFRARARQAEEAETDRQVQALRSRIDAARDAGIPPSFMPLARELADRRFAIGLKPSEGFLCWNEGHFQHALLDLWEITGERTWIDRMVPRAHEVWSLTGAARHATDSLWKKPLPTWYNDTESGTACTLVSGAILWPIARLIRIIMTTPELADLRDTATAWIPPARAVVDFHNPEWIDYPDGSGMHTEPYAKGPRRAYPHGGSRINPLNREFFLTLPMLELARVTGDPEYLRKVTANARYFRNTSDIADGHFQWEYLVAACPADGEDLAHASCQVAFAENCLEAGIVFQDADLRAMARTLSDGVFRHDDVPAETLRGHYPVLNVAVGVWSGLCRYAPSVFPKICAVVATAIHEKNSLFSGHEGWGIRVLTSMEKARQRLTLMTSCTA